MTYTVNGKPVPADSAYIAKLATIPLVDLAPLTEAMDLIENGEEFRKAREHFASLSPERRAQIEAEWVR